MAKNKKESQRKTPVLRFKGFNDDWEQRELGDVSKIYDGIHETPDYTTKGIPFVSVENIKNLTTKKYVSETFYEKKFKVKPAVNDVLMTRIGDIGTSHVVTKTPLAYYVSLALIKFEDDQNAYFFKYLFDSKFIQRELWSKTLHIAFPKKINKNEIGKITIHTTEKDEENHIARLFNKLNNLLALYERKIKLLTQIKKYFLDNLFANKLYPNLRFKGFTDAWKQRKLKDTKTILTDGNYANLYPKSTEMIDADKGIPFLTGGNLKDGCLNLKNAKYITKEKHAQLQSGHLKEDDIVIAVRGSLGELGYVTSQNVDWNINSQLAIIRTFKKELNGNFLLYFFLSAKGKSKLLSRQTGTALKQLPLQQLKTIVIPETQLLEQQKISVFFNILDKYIFLFKNKKEYLIQIKTTFLNTMFI